MERESGQKVSRAKRVAGTGHKSQRAKVATIIARLDAAYPDAQCALYYETPYQLLVSVVLSAQANDRIVNRCMRPHHERGLDLTTVLQWGYAQLLRNIKQIGLAPTKAKNIIALSKILQNTHGGQVPDDRQALEALPGVGRKTANVILGELFQQQVLAVDTHVFRTTARLGLHTAKPLRPANDNCSPSLTATTYHTPTTCSSPTAATSATRAAPPAATACSTISVVSSQKYPRQRKGLSHHPPKNCFHTRQ